MVLTLDGKKESQPTTVPFNTSRFKHRPQRADPVRVGTYAFRRIYGQDMKIRAAFEINTHCSVLYACANGPLQRFVAAHEHLQGAQGNRQGAGRDRKV